MKPVDFLAPENVLVDVEAPNKIDLIRELSRLAAAAVGIPPDQILSALHKREQLGSTGMGQGIALPHARYEQLKKPFGLLARLKRPVQFDAIDELPVDIVFLLLLPASPQGEQLNTLAIVARKLRDDKVVRDIRRASNSAGVFHALV
jgi:PTS system nitrogen regulatory IIA component